MNTVLDNECPQLVVLNGDLITGENTFLQNSTDYVDEIVAPLVRRRLLWASTYGNHDNDYNLSTKNILAREHRYPYSLTNSMVQVNLLVFRTIIFRFMRTVNLTFTMRYQKFFYGSLIVEVVITTKNLAQMVPKCHKEIGLMNP